MRINVAINLRVVFFLLIFATHSSFAEDDPLPSWADGETKTSILDFVELVSGPDSVQRVPKADRIAVFDNDGTLWTEQPLYTQIAFGVDRAIAMPADDPNRENLPPLSKLLTGDRSDFSGKFFATLVTSTHGGDVDEFRSAVDTWIRTARHPRFQRPYPDLAYKPMLELLDYLRMNEFQVWIVTGGDVDFMRVWAPRTYGVSPERIIGSTLKTKFEERGGNFVLVRTAEFEIFNNGPEKPVSIQRVIGKRPIMAFGNSDGDLQMLQWTTAGKGPRFAALIHHTDAEREWSYDRKSIMGRLDKALDQAEAKGWTVVDMQRDWRTVFAWEKEE